jgi:hypothetical protein
MTFVYRSTSVADPVCLSPPGSRILIFTHLIQKQQQQRGEKIFCHTFLCVATNFTKLEIIIVLKCRRKKFGPISKELYTFLSKKLSLISQKYGFGIRDPRSGKNLFRIPDPGVKKAPDPGSATLRLTSYKCIRVPVRLCLLQPLQKLRPLALQSALLRLQRLQLLLHRGKLAVDARQLLSWPKEKKRLDNIQCSGSVTF